MECVDNEARDNIGHLWGAFRELAADYWGPDKSNGRRAIIDDHEKRIDSLETHRIKCEEGDTMQMHYHTIDSLGNFYWLLRNTGGTYGKRSGAQLEVTTKVVAGPISDGYLGIPRLSDHTQPRTLSQSYIMRIK